MAKSNLICPSCGQKVEPCSFIDCEKIAIFRIVFDTSYERLACEEHTIQRLSEAFSAGILRIERCY